MEDACQFFATTVCEDDFGQNGLDKEAKPESDLRETSRNLRKLLPIKPANFPWQWEGRKTGTDSSKGRWNSQDDGGSTGSGRFRGRGNRDYMGWNAGGWGTDRNPPGWFESGTHDGWQRQGGLSQGSH